MPSTNTPTSLHRGLGLMDVALLGISCIVGTRWLATAAHSGPGSITLFLLSGLFFVIPMAQCVGALAARQPDAGGQYVWTRHDFGEWHGFLAFWLYWVGIASWFPNAALAYVSIGAYAISPALAENRLILVLGAVITIWIGMGINLLGVRVGRWNQNLGGISTWLLISLLVGSASIVYFRQGSVTPLNLAPTLDIDTLNLWSQIAFALTGIELLGMMGGEIRDPRRTIGRGGAMAGLASVLFYSAATLAVLVLVRPDAVNVMFGMIQAAQTANAVLQISWLPLAFVVLSWFTALGQFGGIGTATSRLSYAAAKDGLLPPVFARVHPRWQTPHFSMLALTITGTGLLLFMQLGDTLRAAYQELVSMMVLCSLMPFYYIFLSGWKLGLRWAPILGMTTTTIALIFSVIPTADVTNVWLFEAKIIGGSLLFLGFGRWIYLRSRRLNAQAETQTLAQGAA